MKMDKTPKIRTGAKAIELDPKVISGKSPSILSHTSDILGTYNVVKIIPEPTCKTKYTIITLQINNAAFFIQSPFLII